MDERWIVDAMNVIGSRPDGWWKDRKSAMRSFAMALDEHARNTGKTLTVVFDSDPGPLPDTPHVEVVIARHRGRNAADGEILRLVETEGDPGALRVVTSDRDLAAEVAAAGATVESSGSFRDQLDLHS